ncbi:MAG TPA: CotH kinase family protein [Symbiobacteriaceae bacterium]|nr:CotH kinase family protein [Symbiobacteriaceae bacterium]
MAVPEYALIMQPDDCSWFRSHGGTERWFPVLVHLEDRVSQAWIGYRGRFSRDMPKRSYDLSFAETDPFEGHRRLHLNAAYLDPSLLRGRLAFGVFDALQVPTPAAWPVRLTLNGRPLGLYTAIESVDPAWCVRRQMKAEAIYYGVGGEANFGLLNPKTNQLKRYVTRGYEKCHPENEEFSDLIHLIDSITLPGDEEFETLIATVVDVDCFLRWLAGVVFTSHTDGLIHNYALLRLADGRWRISPWDCDGTFGRCPDGSRLPADYMPIRGGGRNYLAARLLQSQVFRVRYRSLLEEALETVLAPERVAERLMDLFAEIRSSALADCHKRFRNSTFLREPALIRRYWRERTAYLQQHLGDLSP